jgi:hypothetical protein
MRAALLIPIALLASSAAVAAEPRAAATEKARAAVGALKKSLKEALVTALKTGPEAAIEVCAAQAPVLASKASTGGVVVGRSALKLRNPANAPAPWVGDALKKLAAKPVDGESLVVDLGKGKFGYAETVLTQPMCLTCHGPAVAAPVAKLLAARYPADQALGFNAGDFRGVFWAEVGP